FLPGLTEQKTPLEELLLYNCEELGKQEMWSLLIFCLDLNEKTIELFLRDWRLPLKEIREIQIILLFLKKRLEQEWTVYELYSAGRDIIISSEKLYLVIKGLKETQSIEYWLHLYEMLPIKGRSEMNVTGSDLMSWFDKSGGPWVKEILLMVEHAIVDGKVVNEKRRIKEWLRECNQ
ncbi:MAG: CCA tRNA nucleotidyltransferase, partial [Bacillus sp. (in: Bacteria)]|nr:CCA tRNA nucleotidyltransferase [Bacillus sp. (in: firmicutes)]